jgi:hypothetical protein
VSAPTSGSFVTITCATPGAVALGGGAATSTGASIGSTFPLKAGVAAVTGDVPNGWEGNRPAMGGTITAWVICSK